MNPRKITKSLLILSMTGVLSAQPSAFAQKGETQPSTAVVLPLPETPTAVFASQQCPLTDDNPDPVEAFPALLAPLLIPIAKAIVQPIIETGVDVVAQKLEKRALELNSSATARANGSFYSKSGTSIDTGFNCIVVLRAQISEDNLDGKYIVGDKIEPKNKDREKKLKKERVAEKGNWEAGEIDKINSALAELQTLEKDLARTFFINSPPEFYLELKLSVVKEAVTVMKDGVEVKASKPPEIPTRFSLRPVELRFRKKGSKRGDGEKQLLLDLEIEGEVADDNKITKKVLYSHTYDFGKLQPGDNAILAHYTAPVSPVPIPSRITQSFVIQADGRGLEETSISRLNLVPFVVTATVREIEDGGDFEKAIASSLKAKKDDIVKPFVTLTEEQIKKAFGVEEKDAGDGK